MIKVESFTKIPLPAPILKKLNDQFNLESEEGRELNLWIETVKKAGVPIRCLHEALKLLFANPAKVEITLEARGLKLYDLKDPQHLAWRDALKEGDSVYCNGRAVILGKRLDEKTDFDNHVYFEIKEGLLLIGINRAVPGAMKETNLKAWGIVPAAILEVDVEGKCAIVERLAIPVKSLIWSSKSAISPKRTENRRNLCSIGFAG